MKENKISMNHDLREKCGLFAILGCQDAARLTYLGLYALQHRGQESAGIISTDGEQTFSHKGMGLVGHIFKENILKTLAGHTACGHVRYSTTGRSHIENAQPFLVNFLSGKLAIAHNGNIVNAQKLRKDLESKGSIFQTTMDTEIIVHLMARSRKSSLVEKLGDSLKKLRGAYSLVFMTEKSIIAARDPHGVRPLCIGKIGEKYIITSETCALDLIEADYIRDVEPGEIIEITDQGLKSFRYTPKIKHKYCVFEYIYFSRPDSNIFGENVYLTRKRLGKRMAVEAPVDADIVVPMPDSGIYAALGYSEESGIPFEVGVIRNHYVGRTFIHPAQSIRDFAVRVKLNPIASVIKGKRVILVDDSIVRGTTSKKRVKTLWKAGAKEIHMRISCPPIRHPCYYGIDFPSSEELIASDKTEDEIAKFLGVDSLAYLSLKGMLNAMFQKNDQFCTACFSGDYPIAVNKDIRKDCLENIPR